MHPSIFVAIVFSVVLHKRNELFAVSLNTAIPDYLLNEIDIIDYKSLLLYFLFVV